MASPEFLSGAAYFLDADRGLLFVNLVQVGLSSAQPSLSAQRSSCDWLCVWLCSVASARPTSTTAPSPAASRFAASAPLVPELISISNSCVCSQLWIDAVLPPGASKGHCGVDAYPTYTIRDGAFFEKRLVASANAQPHAAAQPQAQPQPVREPAPSQPPTTQLFPLEALYDGEAQTQTQAVTAAAGSSSATPAPPAVSGTCGDGICQVCGLFLVLCFVAWLVADL